MRKTMTNFLQNAFGGEINGEIMHGTTAIEAQFNAVAKEYDVNRRKFIPCYDGYYIQTTNFLAKSLGLAPSEIFDLGAGTGLLSAYWYKYFPHAHFTLIDVADEMLSVAKKRFQGAANVDFLAADYTKSLPQNQPDVILSALSIHHLHDDEKRLLFAKCREKLPPNGVFINYDQFCASDKKIDAKIESYWIDQIRSSGLPKIEYEKWLERKKLDKECSVAQEHSWLCDAGFLSAECVFKSGKFAVILARL